MSQIICSSVHLRIDTSKQLLNPKLLLKQAKVKLSKLLRAGSTEFKPFP